jgi:hypothetical protein
LRAFRDSPAPAAAEWRPLLDAELLTLAGHAAEARAIVNGADWSRVPAYGIYYRISWLTEQGDVLGALDLLGRNRAQLDDETRVTLQLAAYAQQGARRPLQDLVDQLLGPPLSPPVIKILAAQLIRYPDPPLLRQFYSRFRSAPVPVTTENAGVIFALLCATGVNADWPRFRELGASLTEQSGTTQAFLTAVEAFFRGQSNATRITSFLPALPMPLEVNYALIARYPGTTGPNLGTVGLPALSPSNGPAPVPAKPAKRPP